MDPRVSLRPGQKAVYWQHPEDAAIDPLTDEHARVVENVKTEEDGRTFQVKAIIGYLDSAHYDYEGVIEWEDLVPVHNSAGKLIGHTILVAANSKILADMSIVYSSPERLDIENRSPALYAWPICHVEQEGMTGLPGDNMKWDFFGSKRKITRVNVLAVELRRERPADGRILPLGSPVLV